MTREEFEASYAERSNLTVEQLRALGMRPYPCGCDAPNCAGWQMLTKDGAETMVSFGLMTEEERDA